MTSKNHHQHAKENDKNTLNISKFTISHPEETPKRRPQSAKYSEIESEMAAFYKTFSEHPDECLCKQCICGRHLCKITSVAPALSMSTTYVRDYPPRNPYKYQSGAFKPLPSKIIENPLLTMSSTYRQHHNELDGDGLERPKPENLIKCKGGPSQELTSYIRQFPGHKGKNQYVPMNPQLFRGGLEFNSSTTYSKEYPNFKGKSASKARPPDQFSMTGSWLGGSSYRQQYQNPKNHVSSRKQKIPSSKSFISKSQKSMQLSNYKSPSSHFQTTYKNDYIKNNQSICPAAKIIDSSNLEKSRYKENSHFKGMDSKYVSLANHK